MIQIFFLDCFVDFFERRFAFRDRVFRLFRFLFVRKIGVYRKDRQRAEIAVTVERFAAYAAATDEERHGEKKAKNDPDFFR